MANFFINRPVFAWVIAIILMMAGALSITNLPVARAHLRFVKISSSKGRRKFCFGS
jgi:hypothetical protein